MNSFLNQTIKHIAFIMDGNRRWAKSNIFGNFIGYKKGMENMIEKAQFCIENKILFATFFALSVENLTRDKEELEDLFFALKTIYDDKKLQISKNKNFKLKIIGNLDLLSPENRQFLENTEKEINANKAADNQLYTTIIIAIAYSGREEIVQACNRILSKKIKEEIQTNKDKNHLNATSVDFSLVNEALFAENLETQDMPDPDILIRTGGAKRLSNFLLWQLSYSELFFTETLWPAFKNEELLKIIENFTQIKRNFGK